MMVYPKRIFFNNHEFSINKQVYEPAEDTFLLVENLKIDENDVILDMGTGCGILAVIAATKTKRVVAVDINPYAIECAERNAKTNYVKNRIEFRVGDLFQSIRSDERFSLILFNAPYLPSTLHEKKDWIEKAWDGGSSGRKILDRFIMSAPKYLTANGRILLVQSSLSDIKRTLQMFDTLKLKPRVLAQIKVPFELLVLIKVDNADLQ